MPDFLARRAQRFAHALTAEASECFRGAVLFADVSGFTALTERLAQKGSVGAEELSRLLERLFSPMVQLVSTHGGDTLHFPGDALLALWPEADEAEGGLAASVKRAVACGLALQSLAKEAFFQAAALSLRVVVGHGDVQVLLVGGHQGRGQVLVRGEPFTQLGGLEKAAAPGEVWVSSPSWQLLGSEAQGHVGPSGMAKVTAVAAPRPRSLPRLLREEGASIIVLEDCHWMDSASWELVRRLVSDAPAGSLVLTLRPIPEQPPLALERLREMASTQWLSLALLSGEEVRELVCARLGVERVQDALAAFILRKSEGHPFFCEELTQALREQELLVAEHGVCRLTSEAGDMESVGLPSTGWPVGGAGMRVGAFAGVQVGAQPWIRAAVFSGASPWHAR
ncbi:Adenylate cyclase [Myxococcus hansupus]|uniref:Adenylate cyclase n=1 Tax=Pseudomyxococcus hansupus TaxID=1297742 RepID=A0A0H4WX36_9BACT|nr:Adenylate cyclase [Myxococcus hansupus]